MSISIKNLQILELVKAHRNGDVASNMARMGIIYGVNYSVSFPELKKISKVFSLAQRMAQSDDENRAWVGCQLLFELKEVEE